MSFSSYFFSQRDKLKAVLGKSTFNENNSVVKKPEGLFSRLKKKVDYADIFRDPKTGELAPIYSYGDALPKVVKGSYQKIYESQIGGIERNRAILENQTRQMSNIDLSRLTVSSGKKNFRKSRKADSTLNKISPKLLSDRNNGIQRS